MERPAQAPAPRHLRSFRVTYALDVSGISRARSHSLLLKWNNLYNVAIHILFWTNSGVHPVKSSEFGMCLFLKQQLRFLTDLDNP